MTDAEWDTVCGLMEDCWKGELDEGGAESYRTFLCKFDSATLLAALHRLTENGQPWLPKVPEIVKACREVQEQDQKGAVPSWSEASRDLMRGVAFAATGYHDGDQVKLDKAVDWLERHSHPVVARFFEVEGWRSMALTEWDDVDWGAARRAQLRARWDEFVDVARMRLESGQALQAIGRGGEMRQLDQATLLERMGRPTDAPALESGETREDAK